MTQIAPSEAAPPDAGTLGPPALPRNYLLALRSMYRLTRDKENTRHVFDVVRHANGDSTQGGLERFAASEAGRRVLDDPTALLRKLSDREALRRLPEGTLGRTYAAFMDREGLDTNGVQEAAVEAGVDYAWLEEHYPKAHAYYWHQNLTHDLYHIVTGYNRDAIGEAALLRFTHEHTGSDGIKFIAFFAGLRCRLEERSLPVGKIMKEAAENGAAANSFITADWHALLEMPLGEARAALNVSLPSVYLAQDPVLLHSIGEKFVKPGEEKRAPVPSGTQDGAACC